MSANDLQMDGGRSKTDQKVEGSLTTSKPWRRVGGSSGRKRQM